MKKFISAAYIVLIVFFIVCLAVFPERYIEACLDGAKIWALSVLPSLLPYFFLTSLLTATGKLCSISCKLSPVTKVLYRTGGIGAYVQIMSLLSGYPVGAKIIADLYEKKVIDEDQAARMSTFSSTSGPLFIIGAVGIAMFNSKAVGLTIFISHALSSVICGIIFRKYGVNRAIPQRFALTQNSENLLGESMLSSVTSVLVVGGFVAIFYTLSQIAEDFHLLFILEKPLSLLMGNKLASGFCRGLIECTMGCKILSKSTTALSASLASSLISFGGVSIICQSVTFLKKAQVRTSLFILSKIIQMTITFLISFFIFRFILKFQ